MKSSLLNILVFASKKVFQIFLIQVFAMQLLLANSSTSQQLKDVKVKIELKNLGLQEVFQSLEENTDFKFGYDKKIILSDLKFNFTENEISLEDILLQIAEQAELKFKRINNQILVIKDNREGDTEIIEVIDSIPIQGKVTESETGDPLIGATVQVKGTSIGTITDVNGEFRLSIPEDAKSLIVSFVGFAPQEVTIGGQTQFEISLQDDISDLNEVIVVGYGTAKKMDLTGSVVRANVDAFREQPNISIGQSLQGSVPGLNVGQINQAGQDPQITIRGTTSISGETQPLIVVDGIIYRGNLIDLNPADVASVDILKDASSAAIYGSQAANGVMIITTKKSGGVNGKPSINYSGYYTFQEPHKTFEYESADYFISKNERGDFLNSRTEESGYLEPNPAYSITSTFDTGEEIAAYQAGETVNWYEQLTNSNMHTQSHNLSISNKNDYSNYYISLGYSDQEGHMLNEGYERITARLNIDNTITDWFSVGIQTSGAVSDYSGATFTPRYRYENNPYSPIYDDNGDFIPTPGSQLINPLILSTSDNSNSRLNLFANIYSKISLPFIEGLTYTTRFNDNYITNSVYNFNDYGANFRGEGSKYEDKYNSWTLDNIVAYSQTFSNDHAIDLTLLYGVEKRKFNSTRAEASDFINKVLGYDLLQAGSTDLQRVGSSAWEESSLYQMARLFYGFKGRYLITGTIRRDGFSGFSEQNKFGVFPSVALGWVVSEESFIGEGINWMDFLKLRVSYGSNGNRTISRYETLARVTGGYNYVTADESSIYTHSISSLASPNLKWETTTGINVGVDFEVINNLFSGSIDYYNNTTKDILYNVDIPGISRFEVFPDNLGKMHNQGLDLILTSNNIRRDKFSWASTFVFSLNRNELKELLGFDNDGDGKEDDLVSESLFIGQPLGTIFNYQIGEGFWGPEEERPDGFQIGSYKVVDQDGDGEITPEDRAILGYENPSYRFSINNVLKYDNWTFRLFVNSIQGGKNYYLGRDGLDSWGYSESVFRRNLPKEIDFWSPENTDATYNAIPLSKGGNNGDRWVQRSFVRLQDVSLAYDFKEGFLNRIGIETLKVFLSGKNLLTWTKWPGWDPETGDPISNDGRPVIRSYSMGFDIKF